MPLNDLDMDIYSNEETPYFQVTDKNRVRFLSLFFYQYSNRKMLNEILNRVINEDKRLKGIFSVASYQDGQRFSDYLGLDRFLRITNWMEVMIDYGDDFKGVFAQINLNKQDVRCLISNVIEDRLYGPIIFCTERYIIYISTDVLDIIADENKIKELKINYDFYDKFHENKDLTKRVSILDKDQLKK